MTAVATLHRAIVRSVDDPARQGRVLVTIPSVAPDATWAALCVNSPGNAVVVPEPGDQVVVAFLDGDVRSPVCLGSLWNAQARPRADSHR